MTAIIRPRLHLDFESRSVLNLKEVGAARYARHPSTEVLCLAYAKHGEEPTHLTATQIQQGAFIPIVQAFLAAGKGYMTAHNAFFEQMIYRHILVERYGYPPLEDPAQWDCTLSRALACGLPAKLEKLAEALGLSVQKDMAGNRAMMKLTRPRFIDPLGDPVYWEDPELYFDLYKYCCTDVKVEMAADDRLPELSEAEHRVWELDQKINRRGVRIDVAAAEKGAMLADAMVGPLNERLAEITGGKVKKATQVAVLKKYLEEEEGVPPLDGLDKNSVEDLLKEKSLSPIAREALTIRQQVSKTSTKKFISMLAVADPQDHRARGLLQYHGAATGRWAGRLIQIQNLPKPPKGFKEKQQLEVIAEVMRADPVSFLKKFGSQSMGFLSAILRGMITASEGKTLVVADFAAIEARVLLWFAGDEEALEMLRRGHSLYIAMAEYLLKRDGITKEKDEKEYALGKKIILGCGFQMSGPKFQISCEQDGIVISLEEAIAAVKAYRQKYKSVVSLWYETERAASAAVRDPGKVYKCAGGKIAYGMDRKREFLVCRLPSGRFLRYYKPTVTMVASPWGEKAQIRYWSSDIKGGLAQFSLYGGLMVENYVQATARDFMVNGMLISEAEGYENLFTVHDEQGAEVDDEELIFGSKSLKNFIEIMCRIPEWGSGCPISAEGFTSKRYRKG